MENIANTKKLICTYCESSGAKCEGCELNPTYTLNFQLSKDAKVAMDKGVLTSSGALKMMLEANMARYNALEAVFLAEAKKNEQRDTEV